MDIPVTAEVTVAEMSARLEEVAGSTSGGMKLTQALTPWLGLRISEAARDHEFWGTIFRHSSRGLADLILPVTSDPGARQAVLTAIIVNSGQ